MKTGSRENNVTVFSGTISLIVIQVTNLIENNINGIVEYIFFNSKKDNDRRLIIGFRVTKKMKNEVGEFSSLSDRL